MSVKELWDNWSTYPIVPKLNCRLFDSNCDKRFTLKEWVSFDQPRANFYQAKDLFNEMDTNCDGYIDCDTELKDYLKGLAYDQNQTWSNLDKKDN